jgi:hypothetical protein
MRQEADNDVNTTTEDTPTVGGDELMQAIPIPMEQFISVTTTPVGGPNKRTTVIT